MPNTTTPVGPVAKLPPSLSGKGIQARSTALVLFVLAVGVAGYTGFRVPNDWTATLDAVSLTDGFHRRFLVGTILHPLASATDENYWLFAAVSFLVLAMVIAVAAGALLRARLISQWLLIIAWFLLPTGGFFFNEVGYYDQLLYLLLFLALWLLRQDRAVMATGVMALSVFVHEIAILTVIPIFGLVALRRLDLQRAVVLLASVIVLEGVILAVPPASVGATARAAMKLQHANFPYRANALALFDRTQSQNWQLYSVKDVLVYLVPILLLVLVAFLWARRTDGGLFPNVRGWSTQVACVAIGAPTLLAFAGYDSARWAFLLVTNFLLVLWLALDERNRELGESQILIVTTALLTITHVPMTYFDGYQPRQLGWPEFHLFVDQIGTGSLFKIPPV